MQTAGDVTPPSLPVQHLCFLLLEVVGPDGAAQPTPSSRGGTVLARLYQDRPLCPVLGLRPITPQGRKEDVLRKLLACETFHFDGHGPSDPMNPSQSRLLLENWKTNPLTMGNLRDSRQQDNAPLLAYLPASSTGANQLEDLADEGIDLISACGAGLSRNCSDICSSPRPYAAKGLKLGELQVTYAPRESQNCPIEPRARKCLNIC
jgi:hypothetical protein